MDISGASTAIMLAAAALLWFLYLVPTWFRRREYLATERTATRLQRTIRIMAETAEVPEVVRVEATARDAAQRERMLHQLERRQKRISDAAMRAQLDAAVVRTSSASGRDELARVRIRRARRVAALLVVTGLAAGGIQLWLMATTGVVMGSWVVLAAGVTGVIVGSRMQGQLTRRSSRLRVSAAPRGSTRLHDHAAGDSLQRAWTPVPVPKPLYLEHAEAPRVAATSADATALLRAAAAEAERALRIAHAEPEVVPFRSAPVVEAAPPAQEPSRYARMGVVDAPAATAAFDLDEALRRRTAG